MKLSHLLLVIFLSVATAWATTTALHKPEAGTQTAAKESVYDRVMRTGTIRCGYTIWEPVLKKDPNTGAMSGVYYDYLEALGKKLNLKVEWAYEYSLATYLSDMNAGKYDLECAGGWPNATRGKFAEYTHPLFYLPLYVYVRESVTAYDNNLQALNAPDKTFSTMDVEMSAHMREAVFPLSKYIGIPGNAPQSDMLLQIEMGKADALITDTLFAHDYMARRPGTIRQVVSAPLTVIPNNLSVPAGEFRFLNMLNTATDELIYDGTIERILRKYDLPPDRALRPALPFMK